MEVAEVIADKISQEIISASQRQLIAVKRKYGSKKFHHVSTHFINPELADIVSA